jgi:hypothetical protein
MTELILPTSRLHTAFLECHHASGPAARGRHRHMARRRRRLTRRLRRLHVHSEPDWPTRRECPARPRSTPRPGWIVEDGQVLGGLAPRHIFDDNIGHMG